MLLRYFLFSMIYGSSNKNSGRRSVVATNQIIGDTEKEWYSGIPKFDIKSDWGKVKLKIWIAGDLRFLRDSVLFVHLGIYLQKS